MAAATRAPVICPGHSRPVPNLSFSPIIPEYGSFLISGCLDGLPMLRSGETGDWIGTFEGHKGAVWTARLNQTAALAASASADFTAKVWDAVSGKCLHTFKHGHIVKSVAFSDFSSHLLTAGHEKIIRIFDLNKPEAEPIACKGHDKPISVVLYSSSDENLFYSAGDESGVRVWDKRTLTEVNRLQTNAPVASLQLTYDGGVLTCAAGQEVFFWDAKKLDLIKSHKVPVPSKLLCASLHPNRQCFLSGSADELWVRQWDFETGAPINVHKGHHGPVKCVAFHPDTLTFASGSDDGTIRFWLTDSKPEAANNGNGYRMGAEGKGDRR